MYYIVGALFRLFCILFFKIRVNGRENIPRHGGLLMVSNHQSFLDPLFCGSFIKRPLHFVARDSLHKKPFFGAVIRYINSIPIKRGRADLSAIKFIIRTIREGNGVCLFPEATRTPDGRIAQLKPGFSLLCRRTEVPIVPVVIDGAFEAWPRQRKIFRPGFMISICYGRPIEPERIKKLNDQECADLLTDTLRNMQNECRAKLGKETYNYQSENPNLKLTVHESKSTEK